MATFCHAEVTQLRKPDWDGGVARVNAERRHRHMKQKEGSWVLGFWLFSSPGHLYATGFCEITLSPYNPSPLFVEATQIGFCCDQVSWLTPGCWGLSSHFSASARLYFSWSYKKMSTPFPSAQEGRNQFQFCAVVEEGRETIFFPPIYYRALTSS